MDWAQLTPAIFSLVGVAVGAVGSFLGTIFVQRTAKEQAKAEFLAARREERKVVVLAYLDAVEDSWVLMDGLWGRRPLVAKGGEPLDPGDVDREKQLRNHDVWHHQTRVNLVAPEDVRSAALALTKKIYVATFHPDRVETGLWQYLNPAQSAFLATARKDLEVEELVVSPGSPGRGS